MLLGFKSSDFHHGIILFMVVFNYNFNYIDLLLSTRASGNSTDFPGLLRGLNGNIETIFIKRLMIILEQVHSNTEANISLSLGAPKLTEEEGNSGTAQ